MNTPRTASQVSGMTRRGFLASLTAGGIALALGPRVARAQDGAKKPNIVLIVADDLGYADLGVQGCKDIATPNIDSLAANGMRFTDGYVSCPVCSPTRAGLMTGRYQQRFGHEFNPGPVTLAPPQFGLPATEKTMPERLKDLGYATGMFGKWHLGYKDDSTPLARGFDEFFGFHGGAHSYFEVTEEHKPDPIRRNKDAVDKITYTTTDFGKEAADFVQRHKDHPFLCYLPFNAVHTPLQATPELLERIAGIQDPKRRTFAAMLVAMDDAVGRVLTVLREAGLEENTLIFFISDNGGPTPANTSRNTPLRGFKGTVWEGGVRVPFIVQWKGHIAEGKTYIHPAISLDICPTAVAAAGGSTEVTPPFDGVDLMPFLTGNKEGSPHDRLFWRSGGDKWAVRMGDWKLVRQNGEPGLYNLTGDISESKNLASAQPEKVKELKAAYDAWNSQMIEPRWPAARHARKGKRKKNEKKPKGERTPATSKKRT